MIKVVQVTRTELQLKLFSSENGKLICWRFGGHFRSNFALHPCGADTRKWEPHKMASSSRAAAGLEWRCYHSSKTNVMESISHMWGPNWTGSQGDRTWSQHAFRESTGPKCCVVLCSVVLSLSLSPPSLSLLLSPPSLSSLLNITFTHQPSLLADRKSVV